MKITEKTLFRLLRPLLLLLILAGVTYETIMHQVLGGGKAASVHALCPYGALESLYAVFTQGSLIQKIFTGTFTLFFLSVALTLLFRRAFCGYLCPFGALQELFGLIFRRHRPEMPAGLDRPLRLLKYIILPLTLVMAWRTGTLWMATYDPYSAYAHLSALGDAIAEDPASITGFVLLGITLVGSLVWDRFFCKYLCPAGAFYALLGKVSATRVVRTPSLCVNCNACNRACPVNLKVADMEAVTHTECISCNLCVEACPKKGALESRTFGRKLPPVAVLLLTAVLFFGGIQLAGLAGLMQTTPRAAASGEILPVAELKGYYTIDEAIRATGMTAGDFRKRMEIPDSVAGDTMLKDISKAVPGYSLDAEKNR